MGLQEQLSHSDGELKRNNVISGHGHRGICQKFVADGGILREERYWN